MFALTKPDRERITEMRAGCNAGGHRSSPLHYLTIEMMLTLEQPRLRSYARDGPERLRWVLSAHCTSNEPLPWFLCVPSSAVYRFEIYLYQLPIIRTPLARGARLAAISYSSLHASRQLPMTQVLCLPFIQFRPSEICFTSHPCLCSLGHSHLGFGV